MSDEKLKTLKDILNESRYSKEGEIKLDAVLTADLEQEAIKWIMYGLKYERNFFKVFMEFFNITEQDLK
ncbi:MAG: hypothetical protein QQN41_11325 [Nitrosopumilus sp.]